MAVSVSKTNWVGPRADRTRKDRIRTNVKTLDFAACCMSFADDKNLHLIYRTLSNFGGKELFVVGSDRWFKGATNGLKQHLPIKYFQNPSEFLYYIRKETDYNLIAIEQSEKSVMITDIQSYPNNSCFIFGNETFGLTDEVLHSVHMSVEIPNFGHHPCLNVGVSSGVAMYDYVRRKNT